MQGRRSSARAESVRDDAWHQAGIRGRGLLASGVTIWGRFVRQLVWVVAVALLTILAHSVSAQSVPVTPKFNHDTTGFMLTGAHIRVPCESCHTQGIFRGTPKDCATCHRSGARAPGQPPDHIPTNVGCDACHLSVNWTPATFRHQPSQGAMQGQCSTCHSGAYTGQNAQTKPANHVATTAQCDTCHQSTAIWTTATFDHSKATPAVAGRCSSCHNGTNALGKPTNHIPTTAQCDACHAGFSAFAPANMNHAATLGPAAADHCSTCHNGVYLAQNAQTKSASHVATTAQCDTCHVSTSSWVTAAFDHSKATPPVAGRCSICHNGSNALGKPTTHIPTTAQCDTCHANTSAFSPATMNHAATAGPAAAGNCSTCHGGAYTTQNAQTKPATHIATTAQCDTCHTSTTSWATATFDHGKVTPAAAGRCSSCHNGTNALGKPTTHIPTTAQCDTCHKNYTVFNPAQMDHAGTSGPIATGNCATCHNGNYSAANAQAKPATHIPTTSQCDTCHTNTSAFSPTTMNHAATAGPTSAANCSTCHGGVYTSQNAQTKPATHIATTAQCDTCHTSTSSWATATFDHSKATPPVAGRCSSCHNGTNSLGKPANHIPTTAQCDSCHTNFSAFKPAQMNHTGVGACANCHNGDYAFANALGKPSAHIPTNSACDTCHKNTVAFSPASMDHTGLNGQCSTCHGGAYTPQNAQTKPATHIATTAQCDTCHTSTTSWATATFDHSKATPPVAGRCSNCHNGTNALGKPTTHVPTAAQCDTCHANFSAFKPAQMSHSGTMGPVAAGNCSTCHNGNYVAMNALAQPATHVPSTAQCDTCHANTSAFSPATMNHAATAGPTSARNCSTCHGGAYISQNAQTKPATHIATTAQCDTCHTSTSSWATATFDHSKATPPVAGRCASCHNGTNALGKPTTHIPTAAQCDTCHKNYTAFNPAQMDHAGTSGPVATGSCSTCHNGNYVAANALSKPATHIPTTSQCDTCHTGTSAFSLATMNHAATAGPTSAGNCSTCHGGAYTSQNAQTKPATHIATTAQCDTCHTSTTSWATATFDHSKATPPVAGRCSNCHNGTNAMGKPAMHIPTAAQCDTCHKNYTAFNPAQMDHAGTSGPVATGNCLTCHNGSYVAVNALAKPATHIPTTSQCDTCHTNTSAFSPATMNHAATAGPTSAGNCSTCHSGAYTAQNAQTKPATHIVTTDQCDKCHTSTVSWATATFDHATANPPATGRCSTCHNGTNAIGRPASHIPTAAQCDTCHNNYVAFAPAVMSHSGTTGPVATGNCSTCHNGNYMAVNALAKPATHIPTTSQCDTCHANTSAFAPATMNHAATAGPIAGGNCSTCHGGAYTAQNAQTKPATHIVTTDQCDKCHTSTVSWATATFDHATANPPATGRCSSCHNGTNAMGKPATHIPTAAQCDTCHKNYVAFAPAVMSHSGTTGPLAAGNCATCHNGSYTAVNAQAKTATHIPTTQSCDTCHTTAAWTPTNFSHQGVVAGSCATCHNGVNASGKPAGTHIPTSSSCDACHHTGLAWLPVVTPYSHTGVAAGACGTCHGGSYQNIDVKPANHLPTTAACDNCHHNYSTWLPATYNHTGVVTGTCQTCHGGTYQDVVTKPSNHIPTNMPAGMPGNECSLCHSSTNSFAVEHMNHGTMQTSCATCHDSTSPYAGTMEKVNRAKHHNAGTKDCSSSGCHRPLGNKGTPYSSWDD
jgi:hypothetical protein